MKAITAATALTLMVLLSVTLCPIEATAGTVHPMGGPGPANAPVATSAPAQHEPIVSAPKRYEFDVRIGDPRILAGDVILDFDAETDNIFAAVSWADGWSMNISTDHGQSWQETYFTLEYGRIGMAVAGDYVWVSYSPYVPGDEVRMRRFHVTTGDVDVVYNYQPVADLSPNSVTDISVGANTDDYGDRVFCVFLTDNNSLHFYWDELTGTSFSNLSPPVSDADAGLDFHWNTHGTSGYAAYVSYISTGDTVNVWRVDLFGIWSQVMSTHYLNLNRRTAISAYQGTVTVAHGHDFANGDGIWTRTSHDNGDSWTVDSFVVPAPGEGGAYGVDVSLRSGRGSAALYNREEGSFDNVYSRTRQGYADGPWTDPDPFNIHDAVAGSQNFIEWLGTDFVMSHGMVYFGPDNIPYFDVITLGCLFCDGFESGGTTAWSVSVP